MKLRWVKHFECELCSLLSERINTWLSHNRYATIVGISVYPANGFYCAEVILEEVDGK